MSDRALTSSTPEERTLLSIVRRLPPERVSEVIDFARFLQDRAKGSPEYTESSDRPMHEFAEEEARWDALLASDDSQRLLEQMADEVLAEIRAGLARPLVVIEDDELEAG